MEDTELRTVGGEERDMLTHGGHKGTIYRGGWTVNFLVTQFPFPMRTQRG